MDTGILSGLHKQTLGHDMGQKVGPTLAVGGERLSVHTYQRCEGDVTYPAKSMSSLPGTRGWCWAGSMIREMARITSHKGRWKPRATTALTRSTHRLRDTLNLPWGCVGPGHTVHTGFSLLPPGVE